MKLIFLDIDGVLNSGRWSKARHEQYLATGEQQPWPQGHIDPEAVAVLNEVVEKTGAHVVVSSTWRIGVFRAWLQDQLAQKGFKYTVLGKTPVLDIERGHEIDHWLKNEANLYKRRLGEVTHFVIIDDDTDMVHLYDKLVHIDYETGLTRDHLPLILKHLEG